MNLIFGLEIQAYPEIKPIILFLGEIPAVYPFKMHGNTEQKRLNTETIRGNSVQKLEFPLLQEAVFGIVIEPGSTHIEKQHTTHRAHIPDQGFSRGDQGESELGIEEKSIVAHDGSPGDRADGVVASGPPQEGIIPS